MATNWHNLQYYTEARMFCRYSTYIHTMCTSSWMHMDKCTVDRASLVQTTQETIPFTTVAFSFYGFLLMCSLAFLCWASSLRRLWLGENCLCLLQHTSKRALLRKGKVLREPADCIPIMHHCLLKGTRQGNIKCSGYGQHTGPDKTLVWFDNGLQNTSTFGGFLYLKQNFTCGRKTSSLWFKTLPYIPGDTLFKP